MNYGQVRDATVKLLNQWSVAGNLVEPSYNNQQDYLFRIPQLVNSATVKVATRARRIRTSMLLTDLPEEDLGNEVRFTLPENFYQLISGSIIKLTDGRELHVNEYATGGRHYLVFPKEEVTEKVKDPKPDEPEEVRVYKVVPHRIDYYRRPMLLADTPRDEDELDNDPEVHDAIPFYVASVLIMPEDPYTGAVYNNEFEDRISLLDRGPYVEVHPTTDVYCFGGMDIC